MRAYQPKPRVKIRTCEDYKRPAFIPLKIESDREFLERISPLFEPEGYGALRSRLEHELFSRLKAVTA